MAGAHDDDDETVHEYSAADFTPDEFDTVPAYASGETTRLYLFAAATQVGWMIATAWGLNRLSKPGLSTPDKILTVIIMITAIVVCVRAWSEAYHSAARDKDRKGPHS